MRDLAALQTYMLAQNERVIWCLSPWGGKLSGHRAHSIADQFHCGLSPNRRGFLLLLSKEQTT